MKKALKSYLIKPIFSWLLLFLLIFLAVYPIFTSYVSGTADGLGHRFRLVSFANSLKSGFLRPRWSKEAALGFGAPVFFFNYPLPYYLASFFLKMGFSVNISGQLLAAFSLFFSAVFMFLLGRRLWGKQAGLVAAVIYTFAPYHLQMTYLYDAWGEELAFVFPPLLLYLIINVFKKSNPFNFALLTITWFLFLLSHNVSALIFTPVLLLLSFLASGRQWVKTLLVINAFVLGLLMSAFFWLPAWSMRNQMQYPNFIFSESAIRKLYFFKSLSFQLATGIKVIKEGIADYLDFSVGIPLLAAAFLALAVLGKQFLTIFPLFRKIVKKLRIISANKFDFSIKIWLITYFLIFLLSLYLVNGASNWLWQLPFLNYVLYPFRFLFLASFSGAILAGIIFRKNILLAGIIILFALLQGRPYTKPHIDIFPFSNNYFYQIQTVFAAPQTRKNMLIKEFLPKNASLAYLEEEEKKYSGTFISLLPAPYEEIEIVKGEGTVNLVENKSERITAEILGKTELTLLFHRFYFPNWQVFLEGRRMPLILTETGRMMLQLPAGQYHLLLSFGTTAIEKLAWLITGLGVIVFGGEIYYLKSYLKRSADRGKN